MGGSGGQTLAGAISTSVHGGDFNLAPLPDMVQAIHLVGPGGKQYWIERSLPITDKQILANICPDIDEGNIIYDDNWFNAVLVSMGCLGIIYAFVIEVRDQYGLEEVRAKSTWNTVRPLLANSSLFVSLPTWLNANRQDSGQDFRPRFLEVDINPYPENGNDHVCVVRSRREIALDGLPPPPPPTKLNENRVNNIVLKEDLGIALSPDISGSASVKLGKVVNAAEGHNNVTLVHDLSEDILEQFFLDPPWINAKGVSYIIMDTYDYSSIKEEPPGFPQNSQLRVLSLEIALDSSSNSYLSFIDQLFGIVNNSIQAKKFIAGHFYIRFTAASEAYLAMQQTNRTCHIEMDLLKSADSTRDLLNQFATTAVALGGRLH